MKTAIALFAMMAAAALGCASEAGSAGNGMNDIETAKSVNTSLAAGVEDITAQAAPSGAVPFFGAPNCESVRARAEEFKAKGVETTICLSDVRVEPRATDATNSTICEQLQANTWWSNSRFSTCMNAYATAQYIHAQTGQIIATADLKLTNDVQTAQGTRARIWWNAMWLTIERQTPGWPPIVLALGTECFGAVCDGNFRTGAWEKPTPWGINNPAAGSVRTDNTSGTGIDTMYMKYTAVMVPQVPNSTPGSWSWTTPNVRCDQVRGNRAPDCIIPWYWPTMDRYSISDTRHYQVAIHISNSMNRTVNHWGWNGVGLPLTYTADEAWHRRNHTASCGSFQPDPSIPGDSCDEYPFESTREGASQNSDYTIAHVHISQNESAGGTLGNWYADYHILDGDKFWMYIRP